MPKLFKYLTPLVAAVALVATGCSKPEDAFVGHYTGKVALSQKATDQLAKMGAMGTALKEQMSKATMDLELKKDKTFSMTSDMHMGGPASNASGTWTLVNNQITLAPTSETAAGKASPVPANQTMKLNASADKKTLTPDMSAIPGAADSGTSITFTKA